MTSDFHKSASKNGVSITAYRGNGSALLAFDLDRHLATPLFAGFAVQATGPDHKKEWLLNRLNFKIGLNSDSTPNDRQKNWTESNKAPFQKYRWQHFPASPQLGTYTYEVTPMYFASKQSASLKPGPTSVSVSIDMVPSDYDKLQIGFTRSYVSSQAYFEQFGNADIRQLPKTLDFNTTKFEKQYEFLGHTARKLMFDFLAESRKPGTKLDVFAYDFDEPDILKALEDLGPRLRIWLDDAPLHNARASFVAEQSALKNPNAKKRPKHPKTLQEWTSSILEEGVHQRLVASAGAAGVKRGHFSRFAHHKVMILRDARTGNAIKVLTGSANFSIRGLYVQANNVLIFDDPEIAGCYAAVFDEVWREKKAASSATEFAKCKLAQDWTPMTNRTGLPPFDLCFSPHAKPKGKSAELCSMSKVSKAIDDAGSSVLFAVMQLAGSGSVMDRLKTERTKNKDLFWYGVTQSVATGGGTGGKRSSKKKSGDGTTEQTKSVTVGRPDGKQVLVPFAFLHDNVPAPFHDEVNGGPGQVIHNKFVVVDFNGSNPSVFTGSSNLADGGEEANGDNLIGIYDRSIATMYGVEAIRLIDHYAFRAALMQAKPATRGKGNAASSAKGAKAKSKKPGAVLQLQSSADTGPRWWEDYYKKDTAKFNERVLFIK